MNDAPGIRIGTRGSPLALAQAEQVRARLLAAHGDLTEADLTIVTISTTGDRITDRTLQDAGGKGLFTKEIEEALLDGRVDLAVHSMKDVPTFSPTGLVIDCLLPREDARDALISPVAATLAALPAGSIVGTASLRRQALTLRQRPDLVVKPFRGNVATRLRKLDEGEAQATFLAVAGLNRLGKQAHITAILSPEDMLPAVAQGAIGIQRREHDTTMQARLAPLACATTMQRVTAERALLTVLDGSCRTPIAGYAELSADGRTLWLRGSVTSPDGSRHRADAITGPANDAARLGDELGQRLREYLPSVLAGG